MEEKELKTSPKQRFFIIMIAVIMLGSIIASYIAIVINGNKSSTGAGETEKISEEKIAEYQADYEAKLAEYQKVTKGDFDELVKYKSEVKAFNETSANSNGVQSKDLKVGTGRELGDEDKAYLAYYIGYCADGSVFDSSFDDNDNPTSINEHGVLDLSQMSLIEGWYLGMAGAKVGGVREITIPGELAYGEQEICNGTNQPLKFIVLSKEGDGDLAELASEMQLAYAKYQYAVTYGIDYEELFKSAE